MTNVTKKAKKSTGCLTDNYADR